MKSTIDRTPMIRSDPNKGRFPTHDHEETIRVWQPFADVGLKNGDALEIERNFIGFFKLLDSLDHEQKLNEQDVANIKSNKRH